MTFAYPDMSPTRSTQRVALWEGNTAVSCACTSPAILPLRILTAADDNVSVKRSANYRMRGLEGLAAQALAQI